MATTEHAGAMIALVPTDADLDRLTLDEDAGEPRDELHLTLWFLGEAADVDAATRTGLVNAVGSVVERRELPVVEARAFGVAHWNPASDDPAWVLNVGDAPSDERDNEVLGVVREMMHEAWFDGGLNLQLPPQHSPWQPHVCLAYASDDLRAELTRRLGPLTFDRVRLAFGGEVHDVPLGRTATVAASLGGATVPWHVVANHAKCPDGKPFAVVKDAGGDVEGCHESRDAANAQMAALYAAEGRGDSVAAVDCVDCVDDEHFVGVVAELAWDGSTSRFTDEEYRKSAAACDSGDAPPKTRCFLPHHDPSGALNKAGLHAAAARLNQTKHSAEALSRARSHLRGHYRQLGEEVPDVLKASADNVTLANRSDGDGDCGDGYHRMPDGSCMSDAELGAASRWSGVLIVEGTPTGDGREFAPEALTWADRALLRWQKEGSHGGDHDVTVSVGRIDEVWRDGNVVYGRGVLDLRNADGFELWRRLKDGFAGGISVDADDIADADVELVWPDAPDDDEVGADDALARLFGRPEKMIFHAGRVRAATVVDIPAFVEAYVTLVGDDRVVADARTVAVRPGAVARHQTDVSDATWDRLEHARRLPATLPAVDAVAAYAWLDPTALRGDDVVRLGAAFLHHEVADDGTVGAANVTACAAAVGALNDGRANLVPPDARRAVYEHLATHLRDAGHEPPPPQFEGAITASVVDVDAWRPPREWFEEPKLSVPVGVTVTDQGRVYGHAAQWGECHIGFDELCVTPPRETGHPYFMTGEVLCADGTRVAVGQITVGTGHAPLAYHASRAAEHYDNTGSAVADVAVGNDEHGIWVAGVVRPTVPAARVHELRASGQVSGDWRRIGGQLRLVGLLAVNVPGFPVPRLRARVAAGAPVALVAAGRTTVGHAPPVDEDELNRLALRRVMDLLRERVVRAPETEGV